jgi:hypothetical protein
MHPCTLRGWLGLQGSVDIALRARCRLHQSSATSGHPNGRGPVTMSGER